MKSRRAGEQKVHRRAYRTIQADHDFRAFTDIEPAFGGIDAFIEQPVPMLQVLWLSIGLLPYVATCPCIGWSVP